MRRPTVPTTRYPFPRQGDTALPEHLSQRCGHPPTRVTLYDGTQAWLVTDYATARAVLCDAGFSADVTRPGYPVLSPGRAALTERPTFLRMDAPEHTKLRRMVLPHFTARRVATYHGQLAELSTQLLDAIDRQPPPVDFVTSFARPLPTLTICRLLGVPADDIHLITDVTAILGSHFSTPHAKHTAAAVLLTALTEMVTEQRAHPVPGITSELINSQVVPGHLQPDELADILRLLVTAGHETTAGSPPWPPPRPDRTTHRAPLPPRARRQRQRLRRRRAARCRPRPPRGTP